MHACRKASQVCEATVLIHKTLYEFDPDRLPYEPGWIRLFCAKLGVTIATYKVVATSNLINFVTQVLQCPASFTAHVDSALCVNLTSVTC